MDVYGSCLGPKKRSSVIWSEYLQMCKLNQYYKLLDQTFFSVPIFHNSKMSKVHTTENMDFVYSRSSLQKFKNNDDVSTRLQTWTWAQSF